jgi:hypothetical protein
MISLPLSLAEDTKTSNGGGEPGGESVGFTAMDFEPMPETEAEDTAAPAAAAAPLVLETEAVPATPVHDQEILLADAASQAITSEAVSAPDPNSGRESGGAVAASAVAAISIPEARISETGDKAPVSKADDAGAVTLQNPPATSVSSGSVSKVDSILKDATALVVSTSSSPKPADEKLNKFVDFLQGDNPGACMFHAQMRLSLDGCRKLSAFVGSSSRVKALSLSHNHIGKNVKSHLCVVLPS